MTALAAAGALSAAVLNFGAAFPVVSLDLEVTRSQVLERARRRAARHGWELPEVRAAASFGLQDRMAKTYVELEGGGREVWEEVVSGGEYRPYLWTVRLFRSGSAREARVRFAPDGSADGFTLRLPEDAPGAALSQDSARVLAEAGAEEAWNVRLERYRAVETATETLPSGRADHEFVYQRRGGTVGDARFRLRLGVSGETLSEVRRFVLVPEGFTRRFREMRSSNDLIAFLATAFTGVVYVLVGLGVGLFFLLRLGRLRWGGSLMAGFVVSGLLFGAQLNRLPLAWMGYDTALSEGGFLLQQLGVAGAILVGGGLLLTLVFAVGEGLTRSAFGGHPRLWSVWSRGVVNTRAILGRTLGGYLFTALFLPYSVAFYFLSTRLLGWWTPAEALIQPDLVATPVPWISAVSTSLFAGTFEEALFRAVPLAGAALLGARFGRKKTWIGAAVVLQAVIFAAAHANYPQQPAYARAVELLLPSLAFGVVYLRFGLVPAVIGHYTFNLAWMSLPLWASSAPGVWVDQTAVVLAGLAPLGVVVAGHLRWGGRSEIPEKATNRWTEAGERAGDVDPGEGGEDRPTRLEAARPSAGAEEAEEPRPLHPAAVAGLTILGLGVWAAAEERPRPETGLDLARSQALALAADTLESRGVDTGPPWRLLARPGADRGVEHRFVVEELGRERYRALLGRYLESPGWEVRMARFRGTPTERAEEWRIDLDGEGRIVRLRHLLSEDAPGDSLSQDAARRTALDAVQSRFGIPPERLETITAEAHRRPARRDWTFEFRDRGVSLERGQARIEVRIAGRNVADAHRFVHVPEEWRRSDRSRQSRHGIRALAGGSLLFFAVGALLIFAVVRWSRNAFGVRAFLTVGLTLLSGHLLGALNGYPAILTGMSTSQPLSHQLLMTAGSLLLAGLFLGTGVGLLAGLTHRWNRRGRTGWPGSLVAGLAGGAGLGGIGALAGLGEPVRLPAWPEVKGAGDVLNWLEPALDAGAGVLVTGAILMALLVGLDTVVRSRADRLRTPLAVVGSVLLGFAFAALDVGPSLTAWLGAGILWSVAAGALLLLVRRAGRGVVPGVVAVPALLEQVTALRAPPYPGARAGAVLALVVALAIAAIWTRALARRNSGARPGGP